YVCELCNEQVEESDLHLFRGCPLALSCWDMIIPHKQRYTSVLYDALLALDQLPKEVGLNFIIMACWQIWMQRNDKIFRDENTPQERSSSSTTSLRRLD
uniref:Reverse transcriptase zinc-binding domain-containing protein n=1 Tax=Aegilops tauschii subsp. strangulata TaxID=200361 RepID=A0A453JDW6_AEGTS